jgi:hypothetical protein
MALANIAILLAQRGLRVLAVDWDLEAPGLDLYFRSQFKIASHNDNAGLIDLLVDATRATSEQRPDWRDYVSLIDVAGKYPLSLITSGRPDEGYDAKVMDFDWRKFFEHANGGEFIEELRDKWLEEFNVVLIDSRTGITDSGGVCTIQLPDILALVFTTNEQSLDGVIKVASRAQAARQTLAYDRMPLLVFPLLSRFEGRTEFQEAQKWLDKLEDKLKPFYDDWVPKTIQLRRVLERTKLPYIAFYSFGEPLPAVTEGTSDPEGLGYAYLSAASLIAGDFQSVDRLIRFGPEFEVGTELPPKGEPEIFVSYAWGDDSSEVGRQRGEVVERMCEMLERNGWKVVRDKTALQYGELISTFMKTLRPADHVIIILSDKYLRSPYCMTELYSIYQRSRDEKVDFSRRIIPLVLADARIGTWRDRLVYTKYWEKEFEEMSQHYRELGQADFRLYKSMQEWHNRIGDMLAYLNDVLALHGFDDIVKDDFAGLRQMLSG